MAFFQGTLQEGIAAALQESKSVVCFVTDGEAESRLWEDEFLVEEEAQSLLKSQSVALRLVAGSQEEGFLAQLYPLPKKPTIVIIKNAELKEYIAAGVTKEEFMKRMRTALSPSQPMASSPEPQPQSRPVAAAAAPQPQPISVSTTPARPTQVEESAASGSVQATQPPPTHPRIQAVLIERAARLAEKKKRDDEEAKRQRAERAKEEKPAPQNKHAEELRKKQQQAREERQRILKAIEDDKTARRARKAQAEAERKAAAEAAKNPDATPFAPASQFFPTSGKLSAHCSIQVRLFDSSTIRSRFSSDETLKDVRQWVDETRRDGREPYIFKVLLTPLPSRTIDGAEEEQSLQALGLAPSSTLILLRTPKYATAYKSSASAAPVSDAQGNMFQRFIAYVLAIVTGFFGTIAAFFSTLFSLSGPPAVPEPEPAASQTTQSQTGAGRPQNPPRRRIAGLDRVDERRNDQQFYNGNSTNFEPRPDDGE